jgi:integrase
MAPRTVDGAFKRAVLRANLPPIRLHGLRHGYATMLGRAKIGITLDLYTHLDLVGQDSVMTAPAAAFMDDAGASEEAVRATGDGA